MPSASDEHEQEWNRPVIRIGQVTLLVMIGLSFAPNAYLYLAYGVTPPNPWTAWSTVAASFGAFYLVEPLTYFPVLGLAGTYMSFLAGNISNLRMPCSAMAQEAVGVKSGTPEAEIASTLGIAGSILTNVVAVTIAAIAGSVLLACLPLSFQEALKTYAVPAIFGSMLADCSAKYPALCVIVLVAAVALRSFLGASLLITIVAAVFGAIALGRLFYLRGWIKDDARPE
jgi:hypothetical protein